MTAYFEDALPPADRARFEAHLAICDGCARYVAQMRQTVRLTGTLREEDVDRAARERLLGAFRGWKDSGTD